MKKLIVACLLSLSVSMVHAYGIGDLADEVWTQTNLTILKSATPANFYNLREGRHEAGMTTAVFTYREGIITVDGGFAQAYDKSKRTNPVIGGSIHIDRLIQQAFPSFAEVSYLFIPNSARPFWDKLTVGVYTSPNFEDSALDYGIMSGLELKF